MTLERRQFRPGDIDAVSHFVAWLYEVGPDANSVRRAGLLAAYIKWTHGIDNPRTYVSPDGKTLAQIINLADRRRTVPDEPA